MDTESSEHATEVVFDDAEVWQLATALSGAGTPDEVATALADCGTASAGAATANMAMFDSRTNRVRVVHNPGLDAAIAARWSEFGIGEPTPLSEAILTGHPVLLSTVEAIGANYPGLLPDTLAAGLAATASLPLRSSAGMTIGAVGLGWTRPQAFTSRQMSRLRLIAQLAGEALERATGTPRTGRAVADRAEARVLQEAFLPAKLPRTDHLEIAAAYLPASDAPMGGDWYDAFPVDGGTCLVIGDVAGHGVRSVAVMAQLRNAVRAFADEDPSPGRVMTRLNRMLCRLGDGETATVIVAMWSPTGRTLVHTNAGHPSILRCRPGEFGFLASDAGKGLLIGADPTWQYGEEVKAMRLGTTIVFYTDGLIENRTESLGVTMGQLEAFAEGLPDLSPQAVCDDLLGWRLQRHHREDDVCVVAARMT